jgi:hypothetical protein
MIRDKLQLIGQVAGIALIYLSLVAILLYPAIQAARVV